MAPCTEAWPLYSSPWSRCSFVQTVQLAGIQFDLIVVRIGRGITVSDVEAETSKREIQANQRRISGTSSNRLSSAVQVLNTLHVDGVMGEDASDRAPA